MSSAIGDRKARAIYISPIAFVGGVTILTALSLSIRSRIHMQLQAPVALLLLVEYIASTCIFANGPFIARGVYVCLILRFADAWMRGYVDHFRSGHPL